MARTAERLGFDAFYATDHLMGVAEIGIGSLKAVDTPRPWHPGKLEALAAALTLPRGVQAFGLVAGQVEVPVEFGDGIGLGLRAT